MSTYFDFEQTICISICWCSAINTIKLPNYDSMRQSCIGTKNLIIRSLVTGRRHRWRRFYFTGRFWSLSPLWFGGRRWASHSYGHWRISLFLYFPGGEISHNNASHDTDTECPVACERPLDKKRTPNDVVFRHASARKHTHAHTQTHRIRKVSFLI